jgi:hypothetical protein
MRSRDCSIAKVDSMVADVGPGRQSNCVDLCLPFWEDGEGDGKGEREGTERESVSVCV